MDEKVKGITSRPDQKKKLKKKLTRRKKKEKRKRKKESRRERVETKETIIAKLTQATESRLKFDY